MDYPIDPQKSPADKINKENLSYYGNKESLSKCLQCFHVLY